jgi:hypothetical protein
MNRNLTASDREALIKLAASLPTGAAERRLILARVLSDRHAGTLPYEGDTPLDKVYALTDLMNQIKRDVPRLPEMKTVQDAIYKLEEAVARALK